MAGVTVADVLAVLDELADLCVTVAFDYQWRPHARDPDDDLVLETTINGGADVIASFTIADMGVGARRSGPRGRSLDAPATSWPGRAASSRPNPATNWRTTSRDDVAAVLTRAACPWPTGPAKRAGNAAAGGGVWPGRWGEAGWRVGGADKRCLPCTGRRVLRPARRAEPQRRNG